MRLLWRFLLWESISTLACLVVLLWLLFPNAENFQSSAATKSTSQTCTSAMKGTPINFRDAAQHIPGLRPNQLFRSSVCFTPTEEIHTIIDLRRRGAEREKWHIPEQRSAQPVRRFHVPFVGSRGGLSLLYQLPFSKKVEFACSLGSESVVGSYYFQGAEQIVDMYLRIAENAGNELHQVVSIFANESSGGVAVHCVAGKDRTGIVIALLARLCGADVEAIALDYSLSRANILTADLDDDPFLAQYGDGILANSPKEAMIEFIRVLEQRHGSIRSFLSNTAKLDPKVLDAAVLKLQAKL